MAREGLFNILDHRSLAENAVVLDLFFGTGAMSLEFISRGASSVTAIDVSPESKANLIRISREWEIENLKVIKADVFKIFKAPKGRFDLVFADPPYAERRLPEIPDLVFNTHWLESGGVFILEHGSEHDFAEHSRFEEVHRFGNVRFSFFQ